MTTLAKAVANGKAEVVQLQQWIDIFKRVEADKLEEAEGKLQAMMKLRDSALQQAETAAAEYSGIYVLFWVRESNYDTALLSTFMLPGNRRRHQGAGGAAAQPTC